MKFGTSRENRVFKIDNSFVVVVVVNLILSNMSKWLSDTLTRGDIKAGGSLVV